MAKNRLTNPFITLGLAWGWLIAIIVIVFHPVFWATIPMLIILVILVAAGVVREISNRRARRELLKQLFGEDVDPRILKHWRVDL